MVRRCLDDDLRVTVVIYVFFFYKQFREIFKNEAISLIYIGKGVQFFSERFSFLSSSQTLRLKDKTFFNCTVKPRYNEP